MRVFYGGLSNETNAFSPLPCGVGDFAPFTLARAPASRSQIFGALLNRGAELIEGVNLVAQPAGPIASLAYTELRDRLLGEIAQSGPLDAVLGAVNIGSGFALMLLQPDFLAVLILGGVFCGWLTERVARRWP